MRKLYKTYSQNEVLQQLVAEVPWGHNIIILEKCKNLDEAHFYLENASKYGWSRNVLMNFIKGDAYQNKLSSPPSNFNEVLPAVQAERANEILSDKYNLAFLGVTRPILELELERRLIEKIKLFMLELGKGFTYIGNQHRLTLSGKEYFVDLLFFNRYLQSLVAVDLKIGEFKPEYVGKMNFYLNLLSQQEVIEGENAPLGIILCANKDNVEVNVALQGIEKPIGVAEYKLIFPEQQIKSVIAEEIKQLQ